MGIRSPDTHGEKDPFAVLVANHPWHHTANMRPGGDAVERGRLARLQGQPWPAHPVPAIPAPQKESD